MKKNLILVVVVAIIVGGAAFWGGMTYGKSQAQASLQAQRRQLFTNGGDAGAPGQTGGATMRGGQNGGGFVSGDIASVGNDSLTVKQRDGSSKIVLFSASTEISKNASGTAADLTAGKSVTVSGTANQDGSVTANSIQLRTLPAIIPSGSPAPTGN